MKLPSKKEFVIVHYGCPSFDVSEHQVYWIGAVYYENDQKKYFFADNTRTKKIIFISIFLF